VGRSSDYCAEIQKDGLRWEVNLEEQKCTCRAWQVKGTPCIHAAAFIATIRNAKWENYVNSCFTVSRFKEAYAMSIATMPSRNEWINHELGYKMLPSIFKRPPGRPRKTSRIKPSDEPKKRPHKCTRCGLYGHHKSTCKNGVEPRDNEGEHQAHMTQGNEGEHQARMTQDSKTKR
jgi:SWIM zinc finger